MTDNQSRPEPVDMTTKIWHGRAWKRGKWCDGKRIKLGYWLYVGEDRYAILLDKRNGKPGDMENAFFVVGDEPEWKRYRLDKAALGAGEGTSND